MKQLCASGLDAPPHLTESPDVSSALNISAVHAGTSKRSAVLEICRGWAGPIVTPDYKVAVPLFLDWGQGLVHRLDHSIYRVPSRCSAQAEPVCHLTDYLRLVHSVTPGPFLLTTWLVLSTCLTPGTKPLSFRNRQATHCLASPARHFLRPVLLVTTSHRTKVVANVSEMTLWETWSAPAPAPGARRLSGAGMTETRQTGCAPSTTARRRATASLIPNRGRRGRADYKPSELRESSEGRRYRFLRSLAARLPTRNLGRRSTR